MSLYDDFFNVDKQVVTYDKLIVNSIDWTATTRDYMWDVRQHFFTPPKPKPEPPMKTKWLDRITRWHNDAAYHAGEERWRPDFDAILEAADFLGITWDLTVQPVAHPDGLGCYLPYPSTISPTSWEDIPWIREQHHLIAINPSLSPEAASQTLWHELTHAKQAEAYVSPFHFYMAVMAPIIGQYVGGSDFYFSVGFEVEAYENMEWHDALPLCEWVESSPLYRVPERDTFQSSQLPRRHTSP